MVSVSSFRRPVDERGVEIRLSDGSPIVLPSDCSQLVFEVDTLRRAALRRIDVATVKVDTTYWHLEKSDFTHSLERAGELATTASLRCARAKSGARVDRRSTLAIWEALVQFQRAVREIPDTVRMAGCSACAPYEIGLPGEQLRTAFLRESLVPIEEGLKGHLVLAPKDDPLPEILVLLNGDSVQDRRWARSYYDGGFVFPGLPSADYEVELYGPVDRIFRPFDKGQLVRLHWRGRVRLQTGDTNRIVVPAFAAEWNAGSALKGP
jgi:hypothetical protein